MLYEQPDCAELPNAFELCGTKVGVQPRDQLSPTTSGETRVQPMSIIPEADEAKEFDILALPQFDLSDFAILSEVLTDISRESAAERLSARYRRISFRLLGLGNGAVQSSSGLQVMPSATLATSRIRSDLILLADAASPLRRMRRLAAELRPFVSQKIRNGAHVYAIGGAILLMELMGLRMGVKVCAPAFYKHVWQEHLIESQFVDSETSTARQLTYCIGGEATFRLAVTIGESLVNRSYGMLLKARYNLPDLKHSAADILPGKFVPHGKSRRTLSAAVDKMRSNPEELTSTGEIADALDISPRHLQRLFRVYTGKSPQMFYRDLRLERARTLIRQGDQSITQVAVSVGYISMSHFSRSYREAFGITPTEERKTYLKGLESNNCLLKRTHVSQRETDVSQKGTANLQQRNMALPVRS